MLKLLFANFNRLRKDKIFWCVLIVVIAASLVNILNSVRSYEVMLDKGYVRSLDDYYFSQAPMMGVFFALFASLFLGTEYSDGTIRNKLSVGHKREHVYLSNFVVCSVASLVFLAAWLITSALGFWLIGPMEMGIYGYVTYVFIAMGFIVSFAALFTLISCLSSNKAMTIIYTLVAFLVLAITGSGLYDRLSVPKMNEGMMYINGEFVMIEPTPNPLYLSGTLRTICECALDFLPTGQALLMNDAAIEHPARAIVFSAVFIAVALLAGCSLFRKKDIK